MLCSEESDPFFLVLFLSQQIFHIFQLIPSVVNIFVSDSNYNTVTFHKIKEKEREQERVKSSSFPIITLAPNFR